MSDEHSDDAPRRARRWYAIFGEGWRGPVVLLLLVAILALNIVNLARPPRGDQLSPEGEKAWAQYRALQKYDAQVKQAEELSASDATRARQLLSEAVANARAAGVLPWEFPVPSEGEDRLLKYYLSGDPAIEPHERDEFLEYIHRSYPKWQTAPRRKATTTTQTDS